MEIHLKISKPPKPLPFPARLLPAVDANLCCSRHCQIKCQRTAAAGAALPLVQRQAWPTLGARQEAHGLGLGKVWNTLRMQVMW